jgi:hypothetical protein
MRFELTTSTLARWRSTTELRPRRETRAGFLHVWPEGASHFQENFFVSISVGCGCLAAHHV